MADASSSSDAEETAPGRIERLKDRYATAKTHGLERLETERERRASVRMAYDFYLRDRAFAGGLLAGGISVKLFLWFLPFSLSVVVVVGILSDWLGRPPKELAEQSGLLIADLARMVEAAVAAAGDLPGGRLQQRRPGARPAVGLGQPRPRHRRSSSRIISG